MTTEIIRYKINPDKASAFEESYRNAEAILQSSQHCLAYRLLRGAEEPENWVLLLEWNSIEGHEQGFRREPAFQDFFALIKPFVQDIQEMKHYTNRRMNWRRFPDKVDSPLS
jgi:quinol monooxygenase YgiN